MVAGTEVQVPKAQDAPTAVVKSKSGQTSDNLNDYNNSSSISVKDPSNGQNKKKGKYSHKDNDDQQKEKNPNGSNSDNKKKKRKKYVIYSENPPVGEVENASIKTETEATTRTINLSESEAVNVIISDENDNSKSRHSSNISITDEFKKIGKENNSKNSNNQKIEILEEKMRVEERKKLGLEKLKLELVLNGQEEEEEQERSKEEIELSRKGGRGTFSVGCLPKPLNCPKGNTLFPGLFLQTDDHINRLNSFLTYLALPYLTFLSSPYSQNSSPIVCLPPISFLPFSFLLNNSLSLDSSTFFISHAPLLPHCKQR